MKRGVFFDLGRVLLDFDLIPFFAEIARQTESDLTAVRSAISDARLFDRYERGEFDDDSFFVGLQKITGYAGDEQQLRRLWTDIFTPIEKNIALMHALRERYPIGLISNTSPLHISHIEQRFDLLAHIPVRVLSYRVGLMKPDRRIFEHALKQLGVHAEGSVFIDDLEVNLSGAKELGMHVIHYLPEVDLEHELVKLGFPL